MPINPSVFDITSISQNTGILILSNKNTGADSIKETSDDFSGVTNAGNAFSTDTDLRIDAANTVSLIATESVDPGLLVSASGMFENNLTTGVDKDFNGTNVLAPNMNISDLTTGLDTDSINAKNIGEALIESVGTARVELTSTTVVSNSHTTTNSDGDYQSYLKGDSAVTTSTSIAVEITTGVIVEAEEDDTLQSSYTLLVDTQDADDVTSYDNAKTDLVDQFSEGSIDLTEAIKYINTYSGNTVAKDFVDWLEKNPSELNTLANATNTESGVSQETDVVIDKFLAKVNNKILQNTINTLKLIHENPTTTTALGNTTDVKQDENGQITGKSTTSAFKIGTDGEMCVTGDYTITKDYTLPTGQIFKIKEGATVTIESKWTLPNDGNCNIQIEDGGKLVIGTGGKLTIGTKNTNINGGTIENLGEIDNKGNLTNGINAGPFYVKGNIINSGTFTNQVSGQVNLNNGVFNNSGELTNLSKTFTLSENSTLINTGSVENGVKWDIFDGSKEPVKSKMTINGGIRQKGTFNNNYASIDATSSATIIGTITGNNGRDGKDGEIWEDVADIKNVVCGSREYGFGEKGGDGGFGGKGGKGGKGGRITPFVKKMMYGPGGDGGKGGFGGDGGDGGTNGDIYRDQCSQTAIGGEGGFGGNGGNGGNGRITTSSNSGDSYNDFLLPEEVGGGGRNGGKGGDGAIDKSNIGKVFTVVDSGTGEKGGKDGNNYGNGGAGGAGGTHVGGAGGTTHVGVAGGDGSGAVIFYKINKSSWEKITESKTIEYQYPITFLAISGGGKGGKGGDKGLRHDGGGGGIGGNGAWIEATVNGTENIEFNIDNNDITINTGDHDLILISGGDGGNGGNGGKNHSN